MLDRELQNSLNSRAAAEDPFDDVKDKKMYSYALEMRQTKEHKALVESILKLHKRIETVNKAKNSQKQKLENQQLTNQKRLQKLEDLITTQ